MQHGHQIFLAKFRQSPLLHIDERARLELSQGSVWALLLYCKLIQAYQYLHCQVRGFQNNFIKRKRLLMHEQEFKPCSNVKKR